MRFGFNAYFSGQDALNWQYPVMYGDVRYWVSGNWAWDEQVVNTLALTDTQVLLLLTQYRNDMSIRGETAWKDYVDQAAQRWKNHGGVIGVEVLNEPNHAAFGGFSAATASQYAKWARTKLEFHGWTKPAMVNGPVRGSGWQTYLQNMVNNGIPSMFKFSGHPYPQPIDADDPVPSYESQIVDYRTITGQHTLYVTEIGVPVAVAGQPGFGEDGQRDRLEALYNSSINKNLAGMYVFRFQDGPAGEANTPYKWMGTVRQDRTYRPAYHRLKTISGNA